MICRLPNAKNRHFLAWIASVFRKFSKINHLWTFWRVNSRRITLYLPHLKLQMRHFTLHPWHFTLQMRCFKLHLWHFKLHLRRLKLHMRHLTLQMRRVTLHLRHFKLQPWQLKPDFPAFKPAVQAHSVTVGGTVKRKRHRFFEHCCKISLCRASALSGLKSFLHAFIYKYSKNRQQKSNNEY